MLSQVIFISLYFTALANGTRQQRICMQLESVDMDHSYGRNRNEVQTIPGKKGPKGDRGSPGSQGPPGDVDYERLETLVNQEVERAMEKQHNKINGTIAELLERIEKLEEVNEPSTTKPSTTPTISAGFSEQDIVRYNGKIFIPLASQSVGKQASIAKCQEIGGSRSNIYDQAHMDKLMTFIRNNKMDGRGHKAFWTGMTYDPTGRILRLRNGTAVSNRSYKWYPRYPNEDKRNTNVYLMVEGQVSHTHQYLFNQSDQTRYVVCEI